MKSLRIAAGADAKRSDEYDTRKEPMITGSSSTVLSVRRLRGHRALINRIWHGPGSRPYEMDPAVIRTPDDEHLARLLAAMIVVDLRRFPPAESRDVHHDERGPA